MNVPKEAKCLQYSFHVYPKYSDDLRLEKYQLPGLDDPVETYSSFVKVMQGKKLCLVNVKLYLLWQGSFETVF